MFKGENCTLANFVKYIFKIGLHLVAFEVIFLNVGIMLETTKVIDLVPVWMNWTVS